MDKDLLQECSQRQTHAQAKPYVKEGSMRAASIIICDLIERMNIWGDEPNDKKSILIFLPGLVEIFNFIEYCNTFYK